MSTRSKRTVEIEPVLGSQRRDVWRWTPPLLVAVAVALSNFAGTPSCADMQTTAAANTQLDHFAETANAKHKAMEKQTDRDMGHILDKMVEQREDIKKLREDFNALLQTLVTGK